MSHTQLQPAPRLKPRVTTPDSWWQVSEDDSVCQLELTARAKWALDNVYRVEDILDLDLERLPGPLRYGARTKEHLALLREVLRFRFRTDSPDRAAFEAALPRNRIPPSWQSARPETRLETLDLSKLAHRALTACGAATAGDVLDLCLSELQAQKGVGRKTGHELEDFLGVLREHFSQGPMPEGPSVDVYFDQILPRPSWRRNGDRQRAVILRLLGLHPGERRPLSPWPTQTEVAADLELSRARVQQIVVKARRSWHHPTRRQLRADLLATLERHGGVATPPELARALLHLHPSAARQEVRDRRARAVVRAGVEGEANELAPRFRDYRRPHGTFIALSGFAAGGLGRCLADYAEKLRRRGEQLVTQGVPEEKMRRALRKVRLPGGVEPLGDERLVELAVPRDPPSV